MGKKTTPQKKQPQSDPLGSTHQCLDEHLHYETHIATVRVTDTGDERLSESHLESLALSIPELNHRATGKPHAHTFLYPSCLEVVNLPWDSSAPLITGARLTSTPRARPSTPSAHRISSTKTAVKVQTPPVQLPLLVQHENDSSYNEDWLKSDEWTTVAYKDHDYIRSFCPIYCAGDDVDVVGCCSVSDYTAYGQPVFSVYMDFLCEDSQTGNDLNSDCRQEEWTRDQDVETIIRKRGRVYPIPSQDE
ncbi:uncharacterized protein LOC118242829 [Electrophorus electricus]|uniref:uncharacterized protein LOC118242829 n=1 Tax=Electrophorus electricus TaxID=8005 RepID=UPI0015D0878F|nr:uncharacterized protein LOC118242829 [Electrophorus electricus]